MGLPETSVVDLRAKLEASDKENTVLRGMVKELRAKLEYVLSRINTPGDGLPATLVPGSKHVFIGAKALLDKGK